jgi:hypothetical protein
VSDSPIDLEYRPKTYFRPVALEKYLLSKVKGAVIRKKIAALFEEGRHDEARELVDLAGLSKEGQKRLESLHPMYIGGNYLPDAEQGEVEIARIDIDSTTHDVTSVYARLEDGVIHYRVVDEYGGETLREPTEAKTAAPMTLGELTDFFLQAWPLIEVLESNFEDDPERALGFFSGTSDFYPEFGRLLITKMKACFSSLA